MTAGVNSQKKKNHETANYHRTQMQKEIVIQRLREQGCRYQAASDAAGCDSQ